MDVLPQDFINDVPPRQEAMQAAVGIFNAIKAIGEENFTEGQLFRCWQAARILREKSE